MKRSKKRDPAREPYASSLNDDQRKALVHRISTAEASDVDAETYYQDRNRANKKIILAKEQIASPNDASKAIFSEPDQSDASATVTATLYSSVDWLVIKAGVSARRTRKKAGMGRHSEFADPATAARYDNRRAVWKEIDDESTAQGKSRLRGRPLANAIAVKTGEPIDTIRTWLKSEQIHRAGLRNSAPKIAPGDWSQLVG